MFDLSKLKSILTVQGFDIGPVDYDEQSQLASMKNWARKTINELVDRIPGVTDPEEPIEVFRTW